MFLDVRVNNAAAGWLLGLIGHGDRFSAGNRAEKKQPLPVLCSASAGAALDFVTAPAAGVSPAWQPPTSLPPLINRSISDSFTKGQTI